MVGTDRVAVTHKRRTLALLLCSTTGVAACLVVWLLSGWFWALNLLVLVCILLTVLLFSFMDMPAAPLPKRDRTTRESYAKRL